MSGAWILLSVEGIVLARAENLYDHIKLGENIVERDSRDKNAPLSEMQDGSRMNTRDSWGLTIRLLVEDGLDIPVYWKKPVYRRKDWGGDDGSAKKRIWCAMGLRKSGNIVGVLMYDVTQMGNYKVSGPEYLAMRKRAKALVDGLLASESTEPAPSYKRIHPVVAYIGALGSEESRRTAKSALNSVAKTLGAPDAMSFDWTALRAVTLENARQHLLETEGQSPKTVQKKISIVKGVMKRAFMEDLIDAAHHAKIQAVDGPRGKRVKKAGRMVAVDELAVLQEYMQSNWGTPQGLRNDAIASCLVAGGLRRDEVAKLRIGDFDPIDCTLLVRGKGDKERVQPLPGYAADRISAWLRARGVRDDLAPMFVEVRTTADGTFFGGKHLSGQSVYRILTGCIQAAGLRHATPHDLRRTYASILMDIAPVHDVKDMMGHASVQTTEIYDRRGERRKRDIINDFQKLFDVGAPDGWSNLSDRRKVGTRAIANAENSAEEETEEARGDKADVARGRLEAQAPTRGGGEAVPGKTEPDRVLRLASVGTRRHQGGVGRHGH